MSWGNVIWLVTGHLHGRLVASSCFFLICADLAGALSPGAEVSPLKLIETSAKHDAEKGLLEAELRVNGKTIPNVCGVFAVVLFSFLLLQLLYSFSTVSITAASSF